MSAQGWTAKALLGEAILWLREEWPEAVIIPELSVASWGGARLDVAAVTPTELVGVEIKGEGDSTARLQLQGLMYSPVCTRIFLLSAPSLRERCRAAKPPGWLMATNGDGDFWSHKATNRGFDDDYKIMPTSPYRLVDMLWADEMRYLFNAHDVQPENVGRSRQEARWRAIANQVPMGKLQPSVYRILYRRRWEAARMPKRVWRPEVGV